MKPVNAITYFKDFNTEGHSPVLILADNGLKYVIKPYNSENFDYYIFNEFLISEFLRLWNIKTPDTCPVFVDKSILVNSQNAKKYNLNCYQKPFFGSQFIEGSIEMSNLISFKKKVDYRKIYRPEQLLMLGLFDIWIENDDRRPTNYNILIDPNKGEKLHFYAIDNAFVFSTLDYGRLTYSEVASSVNDNILFSDLGKLLIKKTKINSKWHENFREKFYLCIEACSHNYHDVVSKISQYYPISEKDSVALKTFLFNPERNKNVLNEFYSRFN